ncbi:MAG: VTT domain-containing protein [Candidatus Caldarchaeum sp.]|nr:VTT domain-containing protein [Candidatus Caldarchaeum sp.]MCS7137382.1 VTT domain-containing protein [Candidatus Caldarchaeum sp.]MDW7978848.1 VTT domain-containing protein [Candidatus Caldarchaeum sp.]MDW8359243.1 VTT domain-containing protein [Candidatus Caldarchaeum sp.]
MNWFSELATAYGPAGVFAVALLGSLVPFLPVPYLFVVVLLSETVDPLILGLAAGLGGSLGKITSYTLGRLGYRFLGQESKNRMDALREIIGRYGEVGVFVFALTPLPDDVYIIPAGIIKLSFTRFLIANTLGKIILSTAVAYLGRTYFHYATIFLGEANWTSVVFAVAAMTVITIILLRVDWELALKVMRESGWRGVFKNLGALINMSRGKKPG